MAKVLWLLLRRGIRQLYILNKRSLQIMAKLEDVLAELDTLKETVAAEQAEVAASVAALKEEIAALKATVEAGGGVSAVDLDRVLEKIKDIEGGVSSIFTPDEPSAGTGG